jgi:hypothetical protein
MRQPEPEAVPVPASVNGLGGQFGTLTKGDQ